MGYGGNIGWSEAYIHLSNHHQHFSVIVKRRLSGLFRPKSMSSIINTYITPLVTIITTYISPRIKIITTHISHFFSMTTIS